MGKLNRKPLSPQERAANFEDSVLTLTIPKVEEIKIRPKEAA